jgi:HipA-like protein
MIKLISKFFHSDEQSQELKTPAGAKAHFVLTYKKITIGYLTHEDGVWKYEYSKEFKKQNKISAIIDFPQKEKKYEDNQLWPFFSHRIPGLGQPKIKEIIKEENIDPANSIDLLGRFGERTISNPFVLMQD